MTSQQIMGRRWLVWVLGVCIMGALHFGVWDAVFGWVISPNIARAAHGLRAEAFPLEQFSSKPLSTNLLSGAEPTLDSPQTSLRARGAWVVPATGDYVLRIQCDDNGSLALDNKQLIILRGISAGNTGQAEIRLAAGPHFMEICLNNIEGRGWMRVLVGGPGPGQVRPLTATELRPIEMGNLDTWLRLAEAVKTACKWGLICSFGMVFVLAGLTVKEDENQGLGGWRLAAALGFSGLFFAFALFCNISQAMEFPMGRDEHQFVSTGALLARQGLLPYVDYPFFHTPNLIAIHALLFGGQDQLLVTARTFAAFCGVGCVGIVHAFALRHLAFLSWAPRVLAASLLALLLFFAPTFASTSGIAWNHDLSTFLALSALLLHARGLESPRPAGWFLASGFMIGLAAGTRLSHAPLALAMAVMIFVRAGDLGAKSRWALWLILGGTLGGLPTLLLLLTHPQQTIFGNLVYPLLKGGSPGLAVKLMHLWREIWQDSGNAALLGIKKWSLIIALGPLVLAPLAIRGLRRQVPLAREGLLILLAIPLILLVVFMPALTLPQYFFPLAPVALLAWSAGLGLLAGRPWRLPGSPGARRLAGSALLLAILGLGCWHLAAQRWWPEKPLFYYFPPEELAKLPTEINRWGRELKSVAGAGRVLTMTPIVALEGGLDIYPELAAAPFPWRVGPIMDEPTRQLIKIIWKGNLEQTMAARPPAAILTGWGGESYDEPLEQYAREHGYQPRQITPGLTAWLPGSRQAPD